MTRNVLFRSNNEQSIEAKKILKEKGIDFVEIFSTEDYDNETPVFHFVDGSLPLDGLGLIRDYFLE